MNSLCKEHRFSCVATWNLKPQKFINVEYAYVSFEIFDVHNDALLLYTKKKLVINQEKGFYFWRYYFLTFNWLFSQCLRYSHMSTTMYSVSSIQEVRVCVLEYFLQRYPKDCTRNPLQRTNLLNLRLKLRDMNYQTPFHGDCTLKYPKKKNYHRIYILANNSWNFEAISKSDILKQIYKKGK